MSSSLDWHTIARGCGRRMEEKKENHQKANDDDDEMKWKEWNEIRYYCDDDNGKLSLSECKNENDKDDPLIKITTESSSSSVVVPTHCLKNDSLSVGLEGTLERTNISLLNSSLQPHNNLPNLVNNNNHQERRKILNRNFWHRLGGRIGH